MIVDLLRNDLGRVWPRSASVKVTDLFAVETYPTLHQMVSGVEARLKPASALADIVAGLFPCGSVTGAPKIRAMEIIRELESAPRGVYCGAIGVSRPTARRASMSRSGQLTIVRRSRPGCGIGSAHGRGFRGSKTNTPNACSRRYS